VDRPSRFVVAWATGPRTAALAEAVVRTTRARTAGQAGIPWISDGWSAYVDAIMEVYCDPMPAAMHGWRVLQRTPGARLTQAVKHRRGRRLTGIDVRAPMGPVATQPYAVHIERFNGVLRDRLACLTRKTHAFAKATLTWDAAVSLATFERNWLRPHPALRQPLPVPDQGRRYARRTPAMALGLTDHRWSLTEFLLHPVPHQPRG
jgi:IS1 family transposase